MKIQNIENGKVYKASICSRCGEVFLGKYIGEKEYDGGYTRYPEFEEPSGWSNNYGIGFLCASCDKEFKKTISDFLGSLKIRKDSDCL